MLEELISYLKDSRDLHPYKIENNEYIEVKLSGDELNACITSLKMYRGFLEVMSEEEGE